MNKIRNISGPFCVEKNNKPFVNIHPASFDQTLKSKKTKNIFQTIKSFFSRSSDNKKEDIDIQKIIAAYKELDLKAGQIKINGVYVDVIKIRDYLQQKGHQGNYIYDAKLSQKKITNSPPIVESPGQRVLFKLLKKRLAKLSLEDLSPRDREAYQVVTKEILDDLQKKLVKDENGHKPSILKK